MAHPNSDFEFYIRMNSSSVDEPFGHELRLGRQLPFNKLIAPDGSVAGYVIGWLNGAQRCPRSGMIIGPAAAQSYLEWAHRLSGRFVCFLMDAPGRRAAFYHDAIGSLGLVYDADEGEIAATPNLLTRGGNGRPIEPPKAGRHYGFGETAVRGIRRLLPNFALAADNLIERRCWPATHLSGRRQSGTAAAVLAELSHNIDQVIASDEAALHLTAGLDTRMVLAAAWPHRHRLPFFTFAPRPVRHGTDIEVACSISRRFNLRHFTIAADAPSREALREIGLRTGGCAADRAFDVADIAEVMQNKWRFVGGSAGGEIARAYYWDRGDIGRAAPTADAVLSRVQVIEGPQTREAAEAWLATLPDLPADLVWDLVSIEQRMGHWGGAMGYAYRGTPTVSAFNSAAAVQAILATDPAHRLSDGLARDVVALVEPDLLRIPVNRRSGLRQVLDIGNLMKRCIPRPMLRQLKALRHQAASVYERFKQF